MKVLLIGAKGMLGTDLQAAFADTELTALDHTELDITDAGVVAERLAAERPEVVINAAAYTAVDQAESEREQAFLVNETGVGNIAAAAKDMGATMVHYSTDYVFAGDNVSGYAEDDEPGPPVNAYGESKLAGERALEESGCTFFLLRTAWLYGAAGKNFVATMLRLAGGRDELNVVNDQHGSPTYTVDVAQATRVILDGDYAPGIYHTVNAGTATWYEFAQEIFKLAGKKMTVNPITTAEYPLPAKRPAYSILKNTRGPALRPWQEAIAAYIEEHVH